MATFSPDAITQLNDIVSTTPDAVEQLHALFGLGAQPGLLSDLKVFPEHEHFTDEEIVYEGYFLGKHTGVVPGYPLPTGGDVKLRYVVLYRFDAQDLLVSERARVDLTPLLFSAVPELAVTP